MSHDKQQTAVDFAFEKLANQGLLVTKDYRVLVAYREAKEMEKEQIIDAIIISEKEHIIHGNVYPPQYVVDKAEQYYKQKYGGNK